MRSQDRITQLNIENLLIFLVQVLGSRRMLSLIMAFMDITCFASWTIFFCMTQAVPLLQMKGFD